MASAVGYLPYGLALGLPIAVILLCLMRAEGKKPRQGGLPAAVFVLYLAILLVITFLSRESGSGAGVADLELFSTWGINDRNNAYVVENVLLFVPYGFVCSWAFDWARNFFSCALFGAATSVGVECLQLVTGRGFFQVDDILTNILGMIIGFFLFWLFVGRRRRKN